MLKKWGLKNGGKLKVLRSVAPARIIIFLFFAKKSDFLFSSSALLDLFYFYFRPRLAHQRPEKRGQQK